MLGGTLLVAMSYVISFAMFMIGSINLYQQIDWRLSGHSAVMKLDDNAAKFTTTIGGYAYLDVKYLGTNGETIVRGKSVPTNVAEKLKRGEGVSIFFQKNDPQNVLYSKDELDSPWGWLIAGVAFFFCEICQEITHGTFNAALFA